MTFRAIAAHPYAVAATLLAAALLCSFLILRAQKPVDARAFFDGDKISYERADAFWKGYLKAHGAAASYQALLASAAPLTQSEAHTLAHIFGEALYANEGLAALGVCDERLSYGCLHQFTGNAMAEHGLGIFPQLTEGCQAAAKPAPCLHGIGHGLLAYLGYDLPALVQALEKCDMTAPGHPRNGCSEGVFMEYNLQELTSIDTLAAPRPLSDANRYEPCASIEGNYAHACGYELPVWWGAAQSTSLQLPDLVEWMGKACADAPSEPMRRGCFEGVGFSIGLAAGFERTVGLCGAMADAAGRIYCGAGAVSSQPFSSVSATRALCAAAALYDGSDEFCLSYVRAPESEKEGIMLPR